MMKGMICKVEGIKIHRVINKPSAETQIYNMYADIDGAIHPMPFDTGKEGLWYFDGQFYFQEKGE